MLSEQAAPATEHTDREEIRNKRRAISVSASVMILLLVVATALAPLVLVEDTSRDFSYGTACVAAATGEKPESKLWWNDGLWWAVLFNSEANAYHIYRLGTNDTWDDIGTAVDDRPGTKSDVLWDGSAGKLYVVSHVFEDTGKPMADSGQWARLYRFSYSQPARSYTLDRGFPVMVSQGVSETMTLAKALSGKLWITYVENARVMINHSTDDDTRWGVPTVLPVSEQSTALTTDDISSVIAFGDDSVGVMWSNQTTMKMHFAVHHERDADDVWGAEEVAYSESADDHINLKADGSGRVYAAVKTSFLKRNEPLVLLLVREQGGEWSNYVFGKVGDHHTRPIVLLDETARRLYMFATSGGKNPSAEAGGSIYYKETSIDRINFAPGLGDVFIESPADPLINNATSTKQNVQSRTGLVVLASDSSTRHYLHRAMKISHVSGPQH